MVVRFLVWIIFILGGIALGISLDQSLFPMLWSNLIWHLISFVFGFLIVRLVLKISKNTGRTLAKYGREGELKRMETNKLAKDGIYACMRHPMHLGLFLFPLSFAFLIGSSSFILIIAPSEILLMLIMIFAIEEPEAIKKFGDAYRKYKQEVPAFSFSKSCIKLLLTTPVKD